MESFRSVIVHLRTTCVCSRLTWTTQMLKSDNRTRRLLEVEKTNAIRVHSRQPIDIEQMTQIWRGRGNWLRQGWSSSISLSRRVAAFRQDDAPSIALSYNPTLCHRSDSNFEDPALPLVLSSRLSVHVEFPHSPLPFHGQLLERSCASSTQPSSTWRHRIPLAHLPLLETDCG